MYLTFGEIMMRIAPEGFLRFRQVMPGKLDVTFGGGEANVAVSLALLEIPMWSSPGMPTRSLIWLAIMSIDPPRAVPAGPRSQAA